MSGTSLRRHPVIPVAVAVHVAHEVQHVADGEGTLCYKAAGPEGTLSVLMFRWFLK